MSYASALVKDGQVVGGMLASPENEAHAPNLTDAVKAQLASAIQALPKDGEIHLVELYQPEHYSVKAGTIKEGLHLNGVHVHAEERTETRTEMTLVPDATP
jgi:hypothetical protein